MDSPQYCLHNRLSHFCWRQMMNKKLTQTSKAAMVLHSSVFTLIISCKIFHTKYFVRAGKTEEQIDSCWFDLVSTFNQTAVISRSSGRHRGKKSSKICYSGWNHGGSITFESWRNDAGIAKLNFFFMNWKILRGMFCLEVLTKIFIF